MSNHTPGPWKVMPGDSKPRICVEGDKGWPIVVVISGHDDEGIKANENLIAAAPDLLAALKKYEILFDEASAEATWNRKKNRGATNWGLVNEILCEMKAAIIKAEGK